MKSFTALLVSGAVGFLVFAADRRQGQAQEQSGA
jgi:hypothetical protein